jgi:hypothetical protein
VAGPTYPFSIWRWRVYDDVTQRRITTRYHMTEEEAYERHPDAEKVPGSEMVIERTADHTSVLRGGRQI